MHVHVFVVEEDLCTRIIKCNTKGTFAHWIILIITNSIALELLFHFYYAFPDRR